MAASSGGGGPSRARFFLTGGLISLLFISFIHHTQRCANDAVRARLARLAESRSGRVEPSFPELNFRLPSTNRLDGIFTHEGSGFLPFVLPQRPSAASTSPLDRRGIATAHFPEPNVGRLEGL